MRFLRHRRAYPALQAACPGEFLDTYAKFEAKVDEHIKKMRQQITSHKVVCDVREFVDFCVSKGWERNDRARENFALWVNSR